MKLKKIIVIPLALLSIFTLGSCSFIENIMNGSGIDDLISKIPGVTDITTTSTVTGDPEKTYTVIWKNGDETLKSVANVKIDNIPSYDGEDPSKEEDEKYQYVFDGWNQESDEALNTITFTAKFSRISKIILDITDWGYKDLQRYENKTDLISLYDEINDACKEFYSSDIDLTSVHKDFGNSEGDYYIFNDKIDFSKYNIDFHTASAVYKCVILDHPEYYFIGNTVLSHSIKSGGVTTSYLELVADEDYKNHTVRLEYNQKIEDYKTTVKEALGIVPLTDKLKAQKIHDYIINNASYAFEADGTTPSGTSYAHNILGIIVEKKGVCESYAKLYKLLMNDNNIECIIATGVGKTDSGNEGHAWNYAKIDDNWYGFDVTWDDPVGAVPTLSHKYFGKVDSTFTNSHILYNNVHNLDMSLEYLYVLPTLASSNL